MKNKFVASVAGLLLSVVVGSQPVIAAGTYGPTAAQETLWSISSRLRPTYTVSTQQVMLAIRAKNPQSFTASNINALKKGSVLKLPSLAEIEQLNRTQALHTARQHNSNWSASTKPVASKPNNKATPARVAAQPRKATLANARKTQKYLKHEISSLRIQLKSEQSRSAKLTAQIKALQASGKNPAGSSADLDKLRLEVTDLKAVLEEKNNHIQNLQASLKEASDAIKRQYADNQVLQEKLKAAIPGLTPPAPSKAGEKPQLTLSGVGNQTPATATDGKPPVFTDQLGSSPNAVPLKSLLAQQQQQAPVVEEPQAAPTQQPVAQTGVPDKGQASTKGNTPSRLSLIIALISLLFILALLWRAFSQQRTLRRETDSYAPSDTPDTIRTAANDPITLTQQKPDGRQEPDIAF
ncbi:MAG: hypothetical protein PHE17_01500 [Thiothrix sp.]|uniref:FimV/HubP family polar landmark protein n=1 Tax=Thiothrix sp. TaxID=1032 RepID=UPI00261F1986|nr:FimV/HubP family polar landmark protein [Thiothrix sp.]MDD5391672.1 hypothetical protein [Thiothrix sp.]